MSRCRVSCASAICAAVSVVVVTAILADDEHILDGLEALSRDHQPPVNRGCLDHRS